MGNQRGVALVMALIVTALLVAAVTEFVHEIYVETSLHRGRMQGEQASLLAQGGVEAGIRIIRDNISRGYTSLLDPGGAIPIRVEDERGKLDITVEEETAKLDVAAIVFPNGSDNAAMREMTLRLLERVELPAQLADTLADWIDANDDPRPASAETPYYRGLQPGYEAQNRSPESLDELRLVRGFEPEVLEKLRPLVTVYAEGAGMAMVPVNVNTAPRQVLEALDERLTPELVKRIMERRATTPFASSGDLVKVPGMEGVGQRVVGKVAFKGSVFRIRSTATCGDTPRTVETVVRLAGGPTQYLYWREY